MITTHNQDELRRLDPEKFEGRKHLQPGDNVKRWNDAESLGIVVSLDRTQATVLWSRLPDDSSMELFEATLAALDSKLISVQTAMEKLGFSLEEMYESLRKETK